MSDNFDAVLAWAAELQHGARSGYRLVMREVRRRVIGQDSLPGEAWLDTLDDVLRLIGKARVARSFHALLAATSQQQPALLPWLQRQPLRALALAEQWPQLLALVAWMQALPRPEIYLRQVDLAGIHSKFIEGQRGVLAELLDLALPADAIDAAASGAAQFTRRYGFRDKPLRVRFRWLDPQAPDWVSGGDGDYTVSQVAFARMEPTARRVFITENDINFLPFPPAADSLVVFGAGYGFEALALAQAGWPLLPHLMGKSAVASARRWTSIRLLRRPPCWVSDRCRGVVVSPFWAPVDTGGIESQSMERLWRPKRKHRNPGC